jgi:predicted DCC family thiol-disulfide oxidoreductase YuxK
MSGQKPQSSAHLILYDGVCGLCNRMNAFVLKHDRKAQFRFASLQSAKGQSILHQYVRNAGDLDTFYIIANFDTAAAFLMDRAHAVLFLLKTLGAPWRWAGILGNLPDGLLRYGYDFVAQNRYRVFGKYDRCVLPNVEHRERFIDV